MSFDWTAGPIPFSRCTPYTTMIKYFILSMYHLVKKVRYYRMFSQKYVDMSNLSNLIYIAAGHTTQDLRLICDRQ